MQTETQGPNMKNQKLPEHLVKALDM